MNNDKICLPKNYVLVMLCVIIALFALYIHIQKNIVFPTHTFNHNYDKSNNHEISNNNNLLSNNKSNNYEISNNNNLLSNNNNLLNNNYEISNNNNLLSNNDIAKKIILNNRDHEVLENNFKPPERRLPFHAYPDKYIIDSINVPSRGYPDNYQLMGLVIRDNTETAYNLFGRQTYPGSNQYEYYVQKTGVNDNVKIPIQIKGNKEIEDDQEITILGMNKEKGIFKIKLYDYNSPKYNPYII